MVIGILNLSLSIPDSNSLKDKRQVLRSLKQRLRNKFNISLAEVDHHDKWQRADFAITCVNNEAKVIDVEFCNLVNFVKREPAVQLLDYSVEVI